MSDASAVGLGLGIILLIWLASGALIGALARLALPGPDPMSWLATIGFGIGGSFLGGIIGRMLKVPMGLDFLLSIAGAAALIWFFRRRKNPPTQPGN